MCREQGYFDLEQIQTAVFEHNGKLSILLKSANRPVTPEDLNITVKADNIGIEVIMDGRIMGENLFLMGLNERWLEKRIRLQGFKSTKDVFLGVYRKNEDKLTLYPNK